jgi:hypothetical protein
VADKDEEIFALRESLTEVEAQLQQSQSQTQHEIGLKQQMIDTLEKANEDLKVRIELIESTRNQAFEKQFSFFEQQRIEFNARVERLQAEGIEKERQIS